MSWWFSLIWDCWMFRNMIWWGPKEVKKKKKSKYTLFRICARVWMHSRLGKTYPTKIFNLLAICGTYKQTFMDFALNSSIASFFFFFVFSESGAGEAGETRTQGKLAVYFSRYVETFWWCVLYGIWSKGKMLRLLLRSPEQCACIGWKPSLCSYMCQCAADMS